MKRLTGGHYMGEIVRRDSVAGMVLTETRYQPMQKLPLHTHERAYMCFVRRGGYTERFATFTREVGPSTLACHPPNERHAQQFHDDEVWSFNLEFSPSWSSRLDRINSVLAEPAAFHGGPVANLANRLYREFRWPDPFTPLAIEGLTLELFAEIGRLRNSNGSQRPPAWLNQVRDVLDNRFEKTLSLGDLAKLAGVHPVHLASTFRRHMGCTIGEYVRQRRVNYASGRLGAPDVPLATIALESGFADQSHFTRVFRRLMGVTPAQYRRQLNCKSLDSEPPVKSAS